MHAGDPPQIYARPLLPVLPALMCGIITGLYAPGLPGMLLAASTVFLLILFLVWKRRKIRLPPLVFFFILGYWSLQAWTAPKLPANHVSRFVDDNPWHIIGTLDGRPQRLPDRTRFILQVESLTRNQTCYKVIGSIRVTVRANVDELRSGDRVGCLARLKEIRNFNNPAAFDYRRHMTFRGIWASAFVSKENLLIRMHAAKTDRFRHALDRRRQSVSGLIERACAQEARGVLKALIVGDRSEISPETREVFNRSGIAHLLAISGLHIGMVATLSFFFFRFLMARSQTILLAAWVSRCAALMSVVPVLFYGLLAGMSPATQRAVIMAAVFLVALVFEQEHDNINTLAVAALAILIISPTALFEISFQLSFVAVFAILYGLEHVAFVSKLKSGPRTVFKKLALFLLVSAAAILGTLPIALYYFNQTSLIGLLTNCLMAPLIGLVVVPLGLLAVLSLPIAPTGALWLMKAAAGITQGSLALAVIFSRCPFAAVKTVTPTLIEIGLYYALAWALFNFRQTRFAKAVLVGIVLIASANAAYWAKERFGGRELRLTVIDVGQGSSALMELPGGRCMLVDGGGFYDNRFDTGASVVAPFLWRKKIATVEAIVLSHPHPDHLNGLLFIARHFNVQEVWMNQENVLSQPYRDFLDIILQKDIRIVGLEGLLRPRTIGGVRFQALYPPSDFLVRKAKDSWRNTNNNSLVLKVTFDKVSFLLPGDIEAEAEKELVNLAGSTLDSDVLLAPHHGSKNSSTPEFLKYVDPSIAVMPAGWKNIFAFPHPKTLKRYETCGCKVFRTDQQGAITITTDGTDVSVKPFLLSS
ncbi:MAG: DNA internalization-related competence protein ComEC/Rec2 [Desulfobacterales bacterium]|nr:DNA internalization-related competence protein ComEC/Rec2 [Desulfobacterales bacterium]